VALKTIREWLALQMKGDSHRRGKKRGVTHKIVVGDDTHSVVKIETQKKLI
jgi:hypothetical protein